MSPPSSDSIDSEPSAPSLLNFFNALVSTSTPPLQSATFRVADLLSSGSVNFISFRRRSSSEGVCDGVPGRNGAVSTRYVAGDGFVVELLLRCDVPDSEIGERGACSCEAANGCGLRTPARGSGFSFVGVDSE